MIKEELQYLSDSKIMEVLASDPVLVKQAGLYEDIGFPSIGNAVKSFFKSQMSSDSPSGYLGAILNLLGPGILGRIHPLLGIFAGIASTFLGLNLTTIFSRFKESLTDHFQKEDSLSMSEADQMAKDAVGLQTAASLEPAAEYLVSQGYEGLGFGKGKGGFRGGYYSPNFEIPLLPDKNKPLLWRVFGNIGKLRGRVLAAGILVWFFKTLLLGAGLVGAAYGAKQLMAPNKEEQTKTQPQLQNEQPQQTQVSQPLEKKKPRYSLKDFNPFTPSGSGQKYFPNNANNLWIVPLVNRSINKTLLEWALDVYPDAVKVEDLFEDSAVFRQTVQNLKKNYNPKNPTSLVMPRQYHTRKQVVDTFIEDVAKLAGK